MQMNARIEVSGPLLTGQPAEIVRQHVHRFVYEAVLLLEREVKQLTPQGVSGAQGGLLSTIKHEPPRQIGETVRGIVATASPYGEVIERGRRPGRGWPPRGSLVRWIEVKFGLPTREAQRIEYLVRRKIARKGFDEGAHMFEKAFNNNLPALQRMAEREGLKLSVELAGE
jgi:hypothetical protein